MPERTPLRRHAADGTLNQLLGTTVHLPGALVRMTRFAWFGWGMFALLAVSEPSVAAPAQPAPRATQTPNRATKPRAHKPSPAKPTAAPSKPAAAGSTPAAASAPPTSSETQAQAPRPGAQEAARSGAKPAEAATRGVTTYHFEAEEVEGRLRSPQILYFLRRVRAQFDPEPLGHRSFLLELSETRRAPALW
ncbi:MAG TPA: hypothetical protein VG963_18340 [Polyangiaceae bacterium]|nr:hypothetical protein [Polyangiaceae bacterium]